MFERPCVYRALADISREVLLAVNAIATRVVSFVDVAGRTEALPEVRHDGLVCRVGGPDETDIDAEALPELTKRGTPLAHKSPWSRARQRGRAFDFLTVLVGTGHETRLVACHAGGPSRAVGKKHGVHVPQVRGTARAINRCCQVAFHDDSSKPEMKNPGGLHHQGPLEPTRKVKATFRTNSRSAQGRCHGHAHAHRRVHRAGSCRL